MARQTFHLAYIIELVLDWDTSSRSHGCRELIEFMVGQPLGDRELKEADPRCRDSLLHQIPALHNARREGVFDRVPIHDPRSHHAWITKLNGLFGPQHLINPL